jgi:DNA-binding transcriptional MerR regulator
MQTPITIGSAAAQLGVEPWQVRRLYERGLLPPAARVGPYRVIDLGDLPRVKTALRDAGYLPAEVAGLESDQPAGREVRHGE